MTGKGLTFKDLLVALKPVARICLSDTKTHPTGVSLHWRACSAWFIYSQYNTPFFHPSVYLFTNSRARRMYKVFKESASDDSRDDAEVFSSIVERSLPSVFSTRPWSFVLISQCH